MSDVADRLRELSRMAAEAILPPGTQFAFFAWDPEDAVGNRRVEHVANSSFAEIEETLNQWRAHLRGRAWDDPTRDET